MTHEIRNRGSRRRTVASVAAVVLGAGMMAVMRSLPRLMERRREVQRIAAQNEELRRQLEREPFPRRFSETALRKMRPDPGQVVFVLQEPTQRRK